MRILVSWHAAVEKAYRRLFHELAGKGIELLSLAPSHWIEGGRSVEFVRDTSENYDSFAFDTVFTNHIRGFFYPNATGIFRKITRFRPDIIYIMEEPFSLAAFQLMLIGRLAAPESRTVIFSFENIDSRQSFPYSYFEKYNLSRADAMVAVPEEGAALWRNRGFRKNIFNIPIGIDTALFRRTEALPDALNEFKNDSAFKVGYAGRLVPEKGIDTLIESAAILKKQGRHFFLYLVGNGDYKDMLLSKAGQAGILDFIRIIPALRQEDLSAFYSLIDVLVLPSVTAGRWKEQFGRVLVEAMSCGTPVIGSSSGEIPNVIGDAGCIFHEKDAHALAGCILKLMSDESLRKGLAIKGERRVNEYYSWKAVAGEYVKMFEEVLRSS